MSEGAIRLTVPVVPVAQPRQRHAVIGGRARNYTPADHPVNTYKAALMLAAKQQGARPKEGALCVDIDFYLPRPKRLMRRRDPDGPIRHAVRPDKDNLEKSTLDALRGLLWRDDAQICDGRVRKWYTEKHGVPRVEITVYEIEEASA